MQRPCTISPVLCGEFTQQICQYLQNVKTKLSFCQVCYVKYFFNLLSQKSRTNNKSIKKTNILCHAIIVIHDGDTSHARIRVLHPFGWLRCPSSRITKKADTQVRARAGGSAAPNGVAQTIVLALVIVTTNIQDNPRGTEAAAVTSVCSIITI